MLGDLLSRNNQRGGSRRQLPPPLLSENSLTPTPIWYRVTQAALEAQAWREKERQSAAAVLRRLEKDLAAFHEAEKERAERERRQQRESRSRCGARLQTLTQRYWARRADGYQQMLSTEFHVVRQYYDRLRQDDLLKETEVLTEKLVQRMRQQPLADVAQGTDVERSLDLLDTLGGARPLRSYQRSALRWLIHLYESDLNGILADEMGLGKTVQTIALFCYFAQYRNDWGPHLVVVPTTVVLNWKEELQRWAPGLKLVTYLGSPKERKELRHGWMKEDAFHVCITSYNLVVNDRAVFRRRPWGFLVLDEAHQVKNFHSKKWAALFDLQVNYRLLLTGTPLQTSLMELWSLFHFLLPSASAFGSDEQFQEWFGKPLDDMVAGRSALNESIVRRLQSLLRPFMLRRLKRDVESQLPSKTEKVVQCRLSRRQRSLYDDYMRQRDTRQRIQRGGVFGVLLALRKVCDHPDLFEERPTVSPLVLPAADGITIHVPRCVLLRGETFSYRFPRVTVVDLNMNEEEESRRHARDPLIEWLPCDWLTLDGTGACAERYRPTHFPFPSSTSPPVNLLAGTASCMPLLQGMQLLQLGVRNAHEEICLRQEATRRFQRRRWVRAACQGDVHGGMFAACRGLESLMMNVSVEMHIMNRPWWSSYPDMCPSISQRLFAAQPVLERTAVCVPRVMAARRPAIVWRLPLRRPQSFELTNAMCAPLIAYVGREAERRSGSCEPRATVYSGTHFLRELWPLHVRRCFSFPDKYLLIHDCGKLQYLEGALKSLRKDGHRVLIFSQFVKMLDILEKFLALIGVAYLRLDGASSAEQRQANVQRFNEDDRITVMILSTRSGGIGLNLTGADTVIFYDSDWNPTMDLQAQDRCHRIGQTRPVTVLRLVSSHTVEENILEKARERKRLNNVVIRGGQFNAIADVAAAGGDEEAFSSAALLLSMKTDIRSFFHDLDEDAEVVVGAATVLDELKDVEDAEDREATERLEAEIMQRKLEDAVEGDDGGEETAAGSGLDVLGNSGADPDDAAPPPLKVFKSEPSLLVAAKRKQQQILSRCSSDVDRLITRTFGQYQEQKAEDIYDGLCASFQEKLCQEEAEVPPFRRQM